MVKGYWSLLLILLILLPSIEAQAYLSIPPTRAFSMINGTGGNVTANSYADFVEFIGGTGITIAYNYALHEIMFNASSSNSLASIHSIGNVTASGCGVGQYLSVNSTGFFVCTTLSGSGETNTASSSGLGQSLVLAKNVFDLPFKGLAVSGDLTISSNTTDITISHTAGGGGNATVLNDLGDVVLTSPTYPSILFYDNGVSQWINKVFSINNQTAINGHFITGINNQTGVITTQTFRSDSITCSAGDFFSIFDNQTGVYTCTTFSGIQSLNFTTNSDFDFNFNGNGSSLTLDSTVFNFRLKNNVVLTNESAQTITKSLTLNAGVLGGQFNIAGNTFLNTGVLTFPTLAGTILNNIAVSNTANTTSVIADNSTLAGRTVFKTLSPGTGVTLTNNANDIVISSTASGGPTSLAANTTSSLVGTAHTLLWTIPLTINSGNSISGVIDAVSNTVGVAPQFGANTTVGGAYGTCLWNTPISTTTTALDLLYVNRSSIVTLGDTAETVHFFPTNQLNYPIPVTFNCSVVTNGTAADLQIFFQAETTGTVTAKAGSYYIKTP